MIRIKHYLWYETWREQKMERERDLVFTSAVTVKNLQKSMGIAKLGGFA